MKQATYPIRTLLSFAIILLLMPLGHALMILMEHFLSTTTLHYTAFAMGFIGLCIVIAGVFVKNSTTATILGLIGALLFWTGWVEFLFSYYAWRYGVHCDLLGDGIVQTTSHYTDGIASGHEFLINEEPLDSYERAALKSLRGSRPEYLIMPATFGMWMIIVVFYTFCTRTGCTFFNFMQRKSHIVNAIEAKPLVRIPAIITFMQFNVMMWACYLLLMFCYDPIFLGAGHWLTFLIGLASMICALYMLRKQLHVKPLGANIRIGIASVILFWTFVEVVARNGFLKEIWIEPLKYTYEMIAISIAFIGLLAFSAYRSRLS